MQTNGGGSRGNGGGSGGGDVVGGSPGLNIVTGLNWSDYCLQWQEFLRWIRVTLVALGVEPAACVQSILTILLQNEEQVSAEDGGCGYGGGGGSQAAARGTGTSNLVPSQGTRDVREVALFERLKNDLSKDQLEEFTGEVVERFYKLSGCFSSSDGNHKETAGYIERSHCLGGEYSPEALPPTLSRDVEEHLELEEDGKYLLRDELNVHQPSSPSTKCLQRNCPESSAFTAVSNRHDCEDLRRVRDECRDYMVCGDGGGRRYTLNPAQRHNLLQQTFCSDPDKGPVGPKSQDISDTSLFFALPRSADSDDVWPKQEDNGNTVVAQEPVGDISSWSVLGLPSFLLDDIAGGDKDGRLVADRSATRAATAFSSDALCWLGGIKIQDCQLGNTTVGFQMPEEIFQFDPWDFFNGNQDVLSNKKHLDNAAVFNFCNQPALNDIASFPTPPNHHLDNHAQCWVNKPSQPRSVPERGLRAVHGKSYGGSGGEEVGYGALAVTTGAAIVPITPDTHFIPIRQEPDAVVDAAASSDFSSCAPPLNLCSGEDREFSGEYFVFRDADEDAGLASTALNALDRYRPAVGAKRTFIVKFKSQNLNKLCQTDTVATGHAVQQSTNPGCGWPTADLIGDALWNCRRLSSYIFPSTDCLDFSTLLWNSETSLNTDNSGGDDSCCRSSYGNIYQDLDFEVAVDRMRMPVQQLDMWRKEDEQDDDQLIRFVSSISLIAPLDPVSTISV